MTLVVHPSEAERQVEVTRQPCPCASCREGERRARAEAQQCREEKAHLEAECAGRTGLLGLIARGLLGAGGIADRNITKNVTSRPGNTLISTKARGYRSDTGRVEGGRRVVQLAVEQEVRNTGTRPWTPAGAVLMGPRHTEWKALGVWPLEPIPPGEKLSVGVEVEATEEEARGHLHPEAVEPGRWHRGALRRRDVPVTRAGARSVQHPLRLGKAIQDNQWLEGAALDLPRTGAPAVAVS